MTLSKKGSFVTLVNNDTQHNKHYCAECFVSIIVMLNVVMLRVIMLNVVMLIVIMLNVVMLSVVLLNVVMLIVIMLKVVDECRYVESR